MFELGMIVFGLFMALIGIPGLLFKLAKYADRGDPRT